MKDTTNPKSTTTGIENGSIITANEQQKEFFLKSYEFVHVIYFED